MIGIGLLADQKTGSRAFGDLFSFRLIHVFPAQKNHSSNQNTDYKNMQWSEQADI